MSLLCAHPRRCRLIRKISRIRGAPENDGEVSGAEDGSEEEREEGKETWRRSPRGWMRGGAEAALEDQAQASSGLAQSVRELEAGCLMNDNRFWF